MKLNPLFSALVIGLSPMAGTAIGGEPTHTPTSSIKSDLFSVRLATGDTLFDENDVETYDAKTNGFVLTPAASKRLVSNWDEVGKDPETVIPKGTFPSADNLSFDVMLGSKKVAHGIVVSGLGMVHPFPHPPSVVLYGGMPLVENEHVSVGIGAVTDGDEPMKKIVEEGPQAVLKPMLGDEVAEHFRQLKKSLP